MDNRHNATVKFRCKFLFSNLVLVLMIPGTTSHDRAALLASTQAGLPYGSAAVQLSPTAPWDLPINTDPQSVTPGFSEAGCRGATAVHCLLYNRTARTAEHAGCTREHVTTQRPFANIPAVTIANRLPLILCFDKPALHSSSYVCSCLAGLVPDRLLKPAETGSRHQYAWGPNMTSSVSRQTCLQPNSL